MTTVILKLTIFAVGIAIGQWIGRFFQSRKTTKIINTIRDKIRSKK